MRKTLLIVFTVALLAVSFSVVALAQGNSLTQECIAFTGFSADVCATCDAFFGNNAGDFGACTCKLFEATDPVDFNAEFANFGQCVSLYSHP